MTGDVQRVHQVHHEWRVARVDCATLGVVMTATSVATLALSAILVPTMDAWPNTFKRLCTFKARLQWLHVGVQLCAARAHTINTSATVRSMSLPRLRFRPCN